MNNDSKTNVAKMLSLIDRMESKGTYNEGMLNESMYINESKRISSDSLLQFLTKYNINKGPFVKVGYIQIYETNTAYPTDDFYNSMNAEAGGYEDGSRGQQRFNNFMDKMSNTEWTNPTGKKNRVGTPMANKLYPYVMKLTTYTIHWQDSKKFGEKVGAAQKGINDIAGRMSDDLRGRMGINWKDPNAPATDTDKKRDAYRNIGELGKYDIATYSREDDMGNVEPVNQVYYNDTVDMTPNNYERTAIRNYLSDIKAQKPVYFGIDEDGNIDPMPKNLGKLLHNKADQWDNKIASLTDPQEIAITKEYVAAVKADAMALKQLLTQNVAYLCGLATEIGAGSGESVYWVNPHPLFLLAKKADKGTKTRAPREAFKYLFPKLNNDELFNIMARFGKGEADSLENTNVQGSPFYADPNNL